MWKWKRDWMKKRSWTLKCNLRKFKFRSTCSQFSSLRWRWNDDDDDEMNTREHSRSSQIPQSHLQCKKKRVSSGWNKWWKAKRIFNFRKWDGKNSLLYVLLLHFVSTSTSQGLYSSPTMRKDLITAQHFHPLIETERAARRRWQWIENCNFRLNIKWQHKWRRRQIAELCCAKQKS